MEYIDYASLVIALLALAIATRQLRQETNAIKAASVFNALAQLSHLLALEETNAERRVADFRAAKRDFRRLTTRINEQIIPLRREVDMALLEHIGMHFPEQIDQTSIQRALKLIHTRSDDDA